MALCGLSCLPFSKPPFPLLSIRRPLLIPSAAGPDAELHLNSIQESQREKPSSQNDILGDLHRAIAIKRRKTIGVNGQKTGFSDEKEAVGKDPLSLSSDNYLDSSTVSQFQISLDEFMGESRVVPKLAIGNLKILITGIQNDSRKVKPGDIFVCCVGCKADGHDYAVDAVKRGAIAVVASRKIDFGEILGCKALIVVEDTTSMLPILAATFYKNPSKRMSVIGITGTNGKTTTAHLVKSIQEAMALKTGMLGTVGYYTNGEDTQLEVPNTTPDAVMVQELMAKMVANGTKTVVMEASSHGLALGRCNEVDFDVAVFTNLTRDHYDFHKTEEEYKNSKSKLFQKMVDPKRHRKVVNLDDSNAFFFMAQGNVDVPVVTYAMENKDADVYPLKFELSLSGTEILISTPRGILEISSGLIGRHNVYNVLAAVAIGIAVGAPLEDIIRGIEGVDGVSGRFEVIDEGQPFGVVVDFAHSPDALTRLLDAIRELGAKRIITVFGCAGESDRGKRSIMTKSATDKSEVVILTSDNPKTENPLDILDGMLAGVGWSMLDYVRYGKNDCFTCLPNGHRLFVHDIRRVAVRAAIAMAEKGDVVVVAGRGHETYQLEGGRKKYIDDREECREALHYVDKLHRAGLDNQIPMVVIRDSLMSFFKNVEAGYTPKKPKEQNSPLAAGVY